MLRDVGSFLLALLESIWRCASSEEASRFGSFLGGVATLGAVIYGAVEFGRWKSIALQESRAAAAKRALPALEKFGMAVHTWLERAQGAALELTTAKTGAATRFRDLTRTSETDALTMRTGLVDAGLEAEVVLREEEVGVCRRANMIFERARTTISAALAAAMREEQERQGGRDLPGVALDLLRADLMCMSAALERERTAGVELLRAIARHEKPPLRRASAPASRDQGAVTPPLPQIPARDGHEQQNTG